MGKLAIVTAGGIAAAAAAYTWCGGLIGVGALCASIGLIYVAGTQKF